MLERAAGSREPAQKDPIAAKPTWWFTLRYRVARAPWPPTRLAVPQPAPGMPEMREAPDVDLANRSSAQDRKKVGIRDAELVTQ